MARYVTRRFIGAVILLVAVSVVAYFLLYLGAGNVGRTLLGARATNGMVAAENHRLGLDQPLVLRYLDWLRRAVTGDFGSSWFTSEPVSSAVTTRLAVTLTLVIGATVVSAVASVIIGTLAATRRGALDRALQVLTVLGFAIPGFLVALVLVETFALTLHWFKPTGYVQFASSPGGWISSVSLPIIALSLSTVAAVSQQVRGSIIDALRQDWVRTLRSRGLSETRVVFRHVLRNAGGPAAAILALQFVGLLGGAVIIEQVFAIPGIGQLSVGATAQGDVPVVMGVVIVVAVIVVVVNLLIDLLQGFLNPKARVA